MDKEVKSGQLDTLGETEWLASGMEIEDEQIFVQRYIRLQGAKPNVTQRLEIAKKRQKLKGALARYQEQAELFLGRRALVFIQEKNAAGKSTAHPAADDPDDVATFRPKQISTRDPEWEHILFPSDVPDSLAENIPGYQLLLRKEVKLRAGQASDALQHIREALSQLAYQFRLNIRNADSTKQTSRAWDGVHLLTKEWRDYRQIYCKARDHILLADPGSANKFPALTVKDCQVSTIGIDGNARGGSKTKLSWLWTANIDVHDKNILGGDSVDEYILECESILIM